MGVDKVGLDKIGSRRSGNKPNLTCHLCKNKNSAEVDIAPAFGEITTACNVGQAKNGSWCLLEE